MKTIAPDYYAQFSCIAGACRHSCCIGWEIDIDAESLQSYTNVPGAFGRRLAESIETGKGGAHFRLAADERCPFLNQSGLCDLIIELGKDRLCQICADHPRFRSYFSNRTEIGLGLCCEEAARLILSQKTPARLVVIGDDGIDDPLGCEEAELIELRGELFGIAQERSMPVAARVERMLDECEIALPGKTPAQWAEVYSGLEQLDPAWSKMLAALSEVEAECISLPEALEIPLEQLLVYFLFRHLPGAAEDENTAGRIAFAALSWRMIRWLCAARGENTLDSLAEIARMYSSEIEYSDENIDALLACLC